MFFDDPLSLSLSLSDDWMEMTLMKRWSKKVKTFLKFSVTAPVTWDVKSSVWNLHSLGELRE